MEILSKSEVKDTKDMLFSCIFILLSPKVFTRSNIRIRDWDLRALASPKSQTKFFIVFLGIQLFSRN